MGEQSERISTARLSQGFLYIQKHTLHFTKIMIYFKLEKHPRIYIRLFNLHEENTVIYKPAQYKCNKVTMLHCIIVSYYTNNKCYLVTYVI